jgi:DNA anti-recombination protein RmuC
MNWELFAALGMVLVSVGSLAAGLYTARGSVRKSDIESLRGIIDELKQENKDLHVELKAMEAKYQVIIRDKDQCIDELTELLKETRSELDTAIKTRQDREVRILELERKVDQLEGKANE